MQSKLTDLHDISQKVGLEINYSKTELIQINIILKNAIMLENRDIKRVPNFTYLGSNVSEDGGAAKDIDIRIQKARLFKTKKNFAIYFYLQRHED
jgi:hypothetical protein